MYSTILFLTTFSPHIRLWFFFFFYCYGDHRDLHSFPTRRSSDLSGLASGSLRCCRGSPIIRSSLPASRARSEEHTSELQSRVDLVCRLLLEKKKEVLTILTLSPSNFHSSKLSPEVRQRSKTLSIP